MTTAMKTDTKRATIYRLVTPEHVCPYGLKSLDLLEREGYEVDDRHLENEAEATAFRKKWEVEIYQSCNLRRTLFWPKIDFFGFQHLQSVQRLDNESRDSPIETMTSPFCPALTVLSHPI